MCFLNLEAVPNTPNRLNILGLCGILFNLLTDLFDMHCNGGNVTDGVHIPDLSEQFFLGKHMIGILCQEGQQIKLLGGEGLLLSIHINAAGCLVNTASPVFFTVTSKSLNS